MRELYGYIVNIDSLIGGSKPRQLNGYKINARLEGSGFTKGNAEDALKIWASYQFGNGDYYRDRTSMKGKGFTIDDFRKRKQTGKQNWSKVVGMDYEDAINEIKNTDKFLMVQVLKVGAMSTMDYKENRVKLFVNKNGIVERVSSG